MTGEPMRLQLSKKGLTQEETEAFVEKGQQVYGPFAPYPLKLSPGRSQRRDGSKWKNKPGFVNLPRQLPRVRGVGEVSREERERALLRVSKHVWGEERIGTLEEMDHCLRLVMAIPRSHAIAYHKRMCDEFARWITYCPTGRGTVGAARKAYHKALQFMRVMTP